MAEGEDNGLFSDDNCWQRGKAERFGWLIDGEDYFRALRESMEAATHEILIVGWDIESGVELVRDDGHPHYPSPLAETLEQLVERKPELRVHVLSWDFALVYVLERELQPARQFGWQESDRLHFELDGQHAFGASHHQKFVVIDGVLAYTGGLDLTKCRWDSREHAPGDERRVNTDGEAYDPFHDVQAIVAGEPAKRLRELADMRWQNATGETLPGPGDDWPERCGARWPEDVPARGKDVSFAIARTWAAADGSDNVREVERLFLDMIAAARKSIYIENQYFTAPPIADALGERLQEDGGPEIVIVLPSETSGWLEQATMDVRRNGLLQQLCENDPHGRLRIVAPVSRELEGEKINVHGKVMVVDDRWARIGSANLSCRSLGLDSECDIVIDDPRGDIAPALRADLIAEHLGADLETVKTAIDEHGLLAALSKFGDGDRRLEALDISAGDFDALLQPVAQLADMEDPVELRLPENLAGSSEEPQEETRQENSSGGWFSSLIGWEFFAVLVLGLVGWATWTAHNAAQDIGLATLLASLRQAAEHPVAPFVAVPAIVVGSLFVAPITGMIALCAILFSPWVASAVAILGTLAATAVNHAIGGSLGNVVEQRAPRALLERMRSLGRSADVVSLAGLRLIPIAPFSVVNLLAGAVHVRLGNFLAGTLLGMGPGIVLVCLSVDRARAALSGEPVFDPWIIAAIAAAGISLVAFRAWQKRKAS